MVQRTATMFVTGLIIVLPVVIAVYAVIWVIRSGERLAKLLFFPGVDDAFYIPGSGILVLVVLILVVGWLTSWGRLQALFQRTEQAMRKVPLFGNVYSPVRDIMDLFGEEVREKLGQVVLIQIPNTQIETLGFITREDLSGLPQGMCKPGHVVVYVQWSSQLGGYCFIVPRESVHPVDMTVEEGMRWALTAGISDATRDAGGPDQSASGAESR